MLCDCLLLLLMIVYTSAFHGYSKIFGTRVRTESDPNPNFLDSDGFGFHFFWFFQKKKFLPLVLIISNLFLGSVRIRQRFDGCGTDSDWKKKWLRFRSNGKNRNIEWVCFENYTSVESTNIYYLKKKSFIKLFIYFTLVSCFDILVKTSVFIHIDGMKIVQKNMFKIWNKLK